MSRTIDAGLLSGIQALGDAAELWLLELQLSGGTVRLNNTPHTLVTMSQTWSGIGGTIAASGVGETPDAPGHRVQVEVSGVDQTVISALMNGHARGRLLKVYYSIITPSTGSIAAPYTMFAGYMNEDWIITEDPPIDGSRPGTATVRTSAVGLLAAGGGARPVLANVTSHRAFLDRSGFPQSTTNTFFQNVGRTAGTQFVWGKENLLWRNRTGSSTGTAKRRARP